MPRSSKDQALLAIANYEIPNSEMQQYSESESELMMLEKIVNIIREHNRNKMGLRKIEILSGNLAHYYDDVSDFNSDQRSLMRLDKTILIEWVANKMMDLHNSHSHNMKYSLNSQIIQYWNYIGLQSEAISIATRYLSTRRLNEQTLVIFLDSFTKAQLVNYIQQFIPPSERQ